MTVEEKKYTPKMTKIVGAEETIQQVKAMLPQSLYVGQRGQEILVFTSQTRLVQQITKQYPNAKVEIAESDETVFRQALKNQAKQNFDCFKLKNAAAEKVTLVLKSAPSDCQVEPAMVYAKAVLASLKQPENVQFSVRGWLLDSFKNLQNEQHVPVQFQVSPIRPNRFQKLPKTIIMTAIISVKDVQQVITAISKLEKTPVALFASDAPRPKREYKPRERKPKEHVEGEEKAEKKPYVKKVYEKKVYDKKPAEKKPYEKKPVEKKVNDKPQDDIVIEVADKTPKAPQKPKTYKHIVELQQFPVGTAEKLKATVQTMIPASAKIILLSKGDMMIEDEDNNTEYLETIQRIKINGTNVTIKK